MKRSELEKYLGKRVKITIFDGSVLQGELHKTGEEKFKYNPNLYIPQNRYFTINREDGSYNSFLFRCSHVKKLEEV